MNDREELTADSLTTACTETLGLIEAVCKAARINGIDELTAYLDAIRKSPAHARQLLEQFKVGRR